MNNEEIQARLEKLESSNRWLKRTLVASAAGLACAVLVGIGANKFGEVQACRFVLVDEYGKTRATLDLDRGEPALKMVGSSGQTQVQLGVYGTANGKASLFLQNRNGSSFATLTSIEVEESAALIMGGGHKRISALTVGDAHGNPAISLQVNPGTETFHAP